MSGTTKVVDREYLKAQFKNFNDILVKPKIADLDDRKVEKVAGYGLSKNDFTDALKTKLEGLSNYDDTELVNAINTLNGDAQTQGSVAQMTADAVAAIVADAPASFDTLKEISDWITSHADSAAAMNTAINANTQAITVLNGDAQTQGSVAHTVKEAMDTLAYEIEDENINFLEFTYTKTPGRITKLFVHLVESGENNENVRLDVSDKITVDDDGNSVYVDADGVKRYDVKLYDDNSKTHINHSDIDYIAVFDVNITGNSSADSFINAFYNNDNKESLLNAIKQDVSENDIYYETYDGNSGGFILDKNGLRDENSSPMDVTGSEFISALLQNDIVGGNGQYGGDRTDTGVKGYEGINISVIGSNDINDGIYDPFVGTLELPTRWSNSGETDIYSYSTIADAIEGAKQSDNRTDWSQGFKGMPIIEKALEEGRALDLAIFVDDTRNAFRHQTNADTEG